MNRTSDFDNCLRELGKTWGAKRRARQRETRIFRHLTPLVNDEALDATYFDRVKIEGINRSIVNEGSLRSSKLFGTPRLVPRAPPYPMTFPNFIIIPSLRNLFHPFLFLSFLFHAFDAVLDPSYPIYNLIYDDHRTDPRSFLLTFKLYSHRTCTYVYFYPSVYRKYFKIQIPPPLFQRGSEREIPIRSKDKKIKIEEGGRGVGRKHRCQRSEK